MVTSVNGSSLAALMARDSALASRTSSGLAGQGDSATGGFDPAVTYGGDQGAPTLSALLSVQDSLNRAASISDVGVSAGQTISDLLGMMREKAAAAQGADSADARQALDGDYQKLLQTIDKLAKSASFQGVKMLDGGGGQDLQFKADVSGNSTIGLTPQDFTAGGPVLGLEGTNLLGSADDLQAVLGKVDAASGALGARLGQMNAQADQIQAHLGLVGQLQSSLAGGGAGDVDADSARLQALQVQQALAEQAPGIVNQAPQALLSLFRS